MPLTLFNASDCYATAMEALADIIEAVDPQLHRSIKNGATSAGTADFGALLHWHRRSWDRFTNRAVKILNDELSAVRNLTCQLVREDLIAVRVVLNRVVNRNRTGLGHQKTIESVGHMLAGIPRGLLAQLKRLLSITAHESLQPTGSRAGGAWEQPEPRAANYGPTNVPKSQALASHTTSGSAVQAASSNAAIAPPSTGMPPSSSTSGFIFPSGTFPGKSGPYASQVATYNASRAP